MKRMLLALSAITLLAGLNGCCWSPCGHIRGCILGGGRNCLSKCVGGDSACAVGCDGCGDAGCEGCGDAGYETCGEAGCETCGGPKAGLCGLPGCFRCCGRAEEPAFTPGPPTGTITYPYYTNRGPRDFLAESPPSIGP